ncbi:PEP-CTERM system TPR-repeat protein PrsT, partial [Massilia arenosa]
MPRSVRTPLALALSTAITALLASATLGGCQRTQEPSTYLASARQFEQKGDHKAAIIQLKNALQQNPDLREARVQLGQVYLNQGDAISAEKELRRALDLHAPEATVRPLLGRAMLRQGKFQDVLDAFPETSDPELGPPILALRAEALLGQNKPDEARELFNQAVHLKPDYAPALLGLARLAAMNKLPQQAREMVDRALAGAPDDVESLRFKADLLRSAGRTEEALQIYRRVLGLKPGYAPVHIDIANILIDGGHFSDARAELAQARKASAGTLAIFYSQAMLDYREGKYGAALESLQQILRVAPDHQPSILLIGAVELALNSLQLAEQHLGRYLAANAHDPYGTKLMATLQLRNGKPEAALELLGPLLEEHGDDVEALALAGEANLRARRFSKASDYFEKASALQPDQPLLRAAAGLSHFNEGDTARAAAELEHAAKLGGKTNRAGTLLVLTYLRAKNWDKAMATVAEMEKSANSPDVQNLKGGVFLAKQDLASARASFEAGLALDPLYMPSLANLAELDLMQKQPEQARQRYLKALDKAPKNPELMEALARLATRQGQTGEAGGWLERAYRDNPDSLARGLRLVDFYIRTGAKTKALSLAEKLQGSNPGNADALGMLARAQGAAGDSQGMADSYGKLAALLPSSPIPLMRQARNQLAAGDASGTVASLRKALALDPKLAEAHRILVGVLITQKKYAEALADARMVQKVLPANALGWRLEGDVAAAEGQNEAALRAYDKAFATGPSGAGVVLVHTTLDRMGRRAEADRRLGDWLKEHQDDLATRLYWSSNRMMHKEYKAALEQLDVVLKADPNNVVALNDSAWACQQLHYPRARSLAERAYKLAPDSPVVLDTLGWIYQDEGDAAKALPLLRKASALAPDGGNFRFHYALALARSGDKAAAKRELEQLASAG